MSKRQHQLNDYLNEYTNIGIEDTKKRIDIINEEIQHLDNERFYLISRLFNEQNRKLSEETDDGDE
jgi:hypothetical protein